MGGLSGALIGTTLWFLLCALMSWWGARQRVVLQGNKRGSFLAFGGWGVLYLAALVLGRAFDIDQPTFWVPAALIAALPLVLVARWPTGRRDRERPGSPARAPAP